MLKLGVLISGRGSNLQAILDAIERGRLAARVAVVLSNRSKAEGLERAAAAGVPTTVVRHGDHADREAFDAAMVRELKSAGVDWVVLAGFMRIVTPVFLGAFPRRVLNIHPSLLPAFAGVDAQQQALDYGVRVSGCTVHLVDEGVDAGPIIAQAVVPVRPDDDRDALSHRILTQEHELLIRALGWIADGRLAVEPAEDGGRPRVVVDGAEPWIMPV
ncbi:MAG: phosphoribosylglycinamide formyltransferase [Polyangiaceae bacterium]